jgi:two-component system, NarL family, nitrate/nitrite response regulator NarL
VVTVMIIAETRLYREALARVLMDDPRVSVVGTAGRGDVLDQVQALKPEVALIDMGTLESVQVARAVKQASDDVSIVALAVPETEEHVLACAEAGVSAYVPRDGSLEQLPATIESVAHGEVRCSPRVTASLMRRIAVLAAQRGNGLEGVGLTTRELQIADLVARGFSNKEIAQALVIEVSTVKNHVHSVLKKMQVHRRAEVAVRLRSSNVAA